MTLEKKKAPADIIQDEHHVLAKAKKVLLYGKTTGSDYVPLQVGDDGSLGGSNITLQDAYDNGSGVREINLNGINAGLTINVKYESRNLNYFKLISDIGTPLLETYRDKFTTLLRFNIDSSESNASVRIRDEHTDTILFQSGYFKGGLRNMSLHWEPIDNNTYDLGAGGNLWRDVYVAGSLKDGTNSIPIANILDKINGGKIGDQTTNYINFSSTGSLTLHGTARVTRDLWIDSAGIKAPGAKPATEVSFGALETSAWEFSNEGVEANQESVSWRIAIPYDMDRSEAPIIRIGWSSASTGNVKWQLKYRWFSEDEDLTQDGEETLTIVDAASTTSNGLVLSEVTGINPPSSTDATIAFKLTRLSADAEDTINDSVELHGVCFNYTSNKLGEAL